MGYETEGGTKRAAWEEQPVTIPLHEWTELLEEKVELKHVADRFRSLWVEEKDRAGELEEKNAELSETIEVMRSNNAVLVEKLGELLGAGETGGLDV